MPTIERDPYVVLGASVTADQHTIQLAYRRLCRLHHPDISRDPAAGARMREINAAYQVLRDSARRQAYDRARIESVPSAVAWEAARRAWRTSARPPSSPFDAEPETGFRARPAALDFGFIRRGEVASRSLRLTALNGLGSARILTRGDWLRVDRDEIAGWDDLIVVTADPRGLHGFWDGVGPDTSHVDGWLEIVDGRGSARVPAAAILRRDAPAVGWWNPFARRVG